MLVLQRNHNQGVVIETSDGPVRVIWRQDNRLAIDAPKKCPILRDELKRITLGDEQTE